MINKLQHRLTAPILAVIGFLLLFSSWAFASPPGSAPDDNFHLPSIWCAIGQNDGKCIKNQDESIEYLSVPESVRFSYKCYAYNSAQNASCTNYTSNLLSEDFIKADTNANGRFPNKFYEFHNLFIMKNLELSVVVFRFINLSLFLILFIVFLFIGTDQLKQIALLTLITTIVPLGVFFISSSHPSSWFIISYFFVFFFIVNYLDSQTKIKTVFSLLFLYLSAMLGYFSRSESYIYFVIIFVIIFMLKFTKQNAKKFILLYPLLILSIFLFLANTNTLGISTGLPSPFDTNTRELTNLIFFNFTQFPQLVIGSFGGWPISWLDTPIPSISTFFILIIYFGLIFYSIKGLRIRSALTLLFLAFLIFVIPTWILILGKNYVGENVQPRYIYPLLMLFIALALYSYTSNMKCLNFNLYEKILILFSFNISHFFALQATMKRFVVGGENSQLDLNVQDIWWWSFLDNPNLNLLVGAIGSLVVSISLLLLLKFPVNNFSNDNVLSKKINR